MVSKTRDKLVEVARQLFMLKGVEHTTMNDIATASERGRRTIYTYFKSKRDIYNAVVERESELVISRLREVINSDLPPDRKLRQYLYVRFDILSQPEARQRTRHDRYLSGIFGRDTRKGERIYMLALSKEADLIRALLQSGVDEGVFDAAQAKRLPLFLQQIRLSSIMLHPVTAEEEHHILQQLIEFIVTGITTSPS